VLGGLTCHSSLRRGQARRRRGGGLCVGELAGQSSLRRGKFGGGEADSVLGGVNRPVVAPLGQARRTDFFSSQSFAWQWVGGAANNSRTSRSIHAW
jgi:hypothetical protein